MLKRPIAHGQTYLKVIRLKTFGAFEEFEAEQAVEHLIETINEGIVAEPIEELVEAYSFADTGEKHLFPIVSPTEIYNTNSNVTIGKRLISPAETENWPVEIAEGGVTSTRVLLPRDEVPEEIDGEYYAAWVGEKSGQYYTPWIIWDIDREGSNGSPEPERALGDTREFVQKLLSYGVSEAAIRVVFSSRKGFHVYLDSRTIGLHPSEQLHDEVKRFAQRMLLDCDGSLYSKRHVIGVPNSMHRTTKLYYIPLTQEELFSMTISQMRAHARRPHEFEPRAEEMQPIPALVVIFQEKEERRSGYASLKTIKENLEAGHYAWKGVGRGQRDKAVFELAQRYRRLGLTIEEAYILVLNANDRNEPPLPRDTVRKKVNSAYNREGVRIA
jgi:hypothetical protein